MSVGAKSGPWGACGRISNRNLTNFAVANADDCIAWWNNKTNNFFFLLPNVKYLKDSKTNFDKKIERIHGILAFNKNL